MWHEARKQERLIRGMIVDYRRRAERRKDFYEKIKAEPTQFLQLHGRPCKIHLDPAIAIAGEGPAIMMPWQGDNNNMIDRFDVRAHLDFIPEVKLADIPPDELEQEERQCNYERYRILAQNVFLGIGEEKFLQQLAIEEQFGVTIEEKEAQRERLNDKKTTGAAIGYNYNNPGEQPSSSYGTVVRKDDPKESDDDSDLEIIDVDLSIDVNKMEASQAHELNAVGPQFGMAGCDLFSFLTGDADDAEHQKQLLREEKEKAMFSGRKSRRERRAHRDKKLASRVVSPPSYAAPSDEPTKSPSRSPSRSPSPEAGNIEFITCFGGEEEEKTPLPQKPLYADKLKQNLKKKETYSEVARKPTMKKLRSCKAQVSYLCKYMAEHKDFAAGKLSIPQTVRTWLQIKGVLDKLGPHRSVQQWKICWRDQKRKVKKLGAVNKMNNPEDYDFPTQNSINTQLVSDIMEEESTSDSQKQNSGPIIRCEPVETLVQENPFPENVGLLSYRKLRSHKAQVSYLCKYMAEHKDFASGKLSIAQTGRTWLQIKAALDKLGPHRSVQQWKICWRDQKRKVKKLGAVNKMNNPEDYDFPTQNSINTQLVSDIMEEESTLDTNVKLHRCRIMRSRKAQVSYLCKYMAEHKDFAMGKLSVAQTVRTWLQIKAVLDKLGPHRSVQQWKICWRDQKRKVKNLGAVNKVNNPDVLPSQNTINTQSVLDAIEEESTSDSQIQNSEPTITCVPVDRLVNEKPVPENPKPTPVKPIVVSRNMIRRVIYPPDRHLIAQLELNSLMKELIQEVRVSNNLREEMIRLESVEDRKRPVMGPHRPKSRSRTRSYSRSRSRSYSRSRSRSRRRSTSSNSRSRSYSPYKRGSRSRSRSRNYRRRSRSPVNHTVGYGRHDSRSSNESNEKAGSSKTAVPRYYGRKKEDKSSSELSVDSESSDSPSEHKTKSVECYKSYSYQNQFRNSGHSSKGSSRETLSLKEKLKRKMQAQLSRQLRADKRAEAERNERESRRQARRDHEMRELAIKLRRKQREMRHQQNRRSSEEESHSDGSHSGSSLRDSPPPEKKNDRFRSRSTSPKEPKRVPVWENDRDPPLPPSRQKPPETGENYPPTRQERRTEDERNYPVKTDRPPRDFRDHGKSDNYYRSDYHEERWGDNFQPDRRRPYGHGSRGGYRGHGFRYGADGPSNWNPRDNQDNRDDQSKKIKLVDY